jgi:TPR repeat protein
MLRMSKLAVCALLPLALISTAAAAAEPTFEDGRRAYDLGAYSSAKNIWAALAQAGDARSAASLAYLLREGKGVARDIGAAAHWYYQAALRGDATAQSALCAMHLAGEGVRRDFQKALFWCELSIEGGETSAIWFRERALRRLTTAQRDMAWAMIAEWRNGPHDEPCCHAAAAPRDEYADAPDNPKR